ncbi:MAG: NAD(P)H-hydrate dehydratase [Acidobacteria bacterium]|nr:NAD(P)H-hydrate dehydratase [Acidobacteriota bacterium]
MRVLTASQMREADSRTIEAGIPGLILMENAASRVVEALVEEFPNLSAERIVILAGKGNNGGDGLAVARQLLVRGLAGDLEVILTADPDALQGDAAANWRMLQAVGGRVRVAPDEAAWRVARGAAVRATVIVDALLGTGLSGPARQPAAEILRDVRLHCADARIVAVDLPSGLPSDAADAEGEVLDADLTVTFTAPKPCQVLLPNAARCGRLRVASIGTTAELLESLDGDRLYVSEPGDLAELVAPRPTDSHKGSFGHVAVIAGSRSKPGAAILAGTAALRSGAGLATVITAQGAAPAIVGKTPELMTLPAAELDDGSLGPDSIEAGWLERADVVAVGPGLGTLPENRRLVERLVAEVSQPLVVDADGLTALAGLDAWPRRTPTLILTPHPGEMARLTGLSTAAVQADRLAVARKLAVEKHALVVLKGARTLIAAPDGSVVVNPTGSPAMATAGSGDVLTGLIAGLLAQFPAAEPRRVVAAAVWLHGKAGEIASERWGERSMLAGDMLSTLPDVFRAAR